MAYQVGQICAAMAYGKHPAQIVVHRAGENAPQDNPQIGDWPELRTHDGAKDWPRAGDIQKLNHEYFPARKNDKVYSIGFCNGWRDTVIRPENPFDEPSISKISKNQNDQADGKCNHKFN